MKSGSSYLSQSELVLTFGMGSKTKADAVEDRLAQRAGGQALKHRYRADHYDPGSAARLNNLGVAYMNQQLFEKALKAFEEAAAATIRRWRFEVVTVNRGVALLNLQRVDEAKALLEKAVKSNPKDAHAWYNLGLGQEFRSDRRCYRRISSRPTEIVGERCRHLVFLGSFTHSQAISRSD
jgi:tetratricopeptide (TPR) repeat protein